MIVGIGTDLVLIDRVCPDSLPLNDPFYSGAFSASELEQAAASGEPSRFLAGRFACKEAVYKALSAPGVPFVPMEIEVLDDHDGAPHAGLSGSLANAAGQLRLFVSLSFDGGFASAVAIAGRE